MKTKQAVPVNVKLSLFEQLEEFSALHDRPVVEVIEEALDYWLQTVGEAETEILTETLTGVVDEGSGSPTTLMH